MNPRFIAYAKAHGRSGTAQLVHDRKAWPGGVMCGFILWMSKMKAAFYKAHPEHFFDRWTIADQKAWTAFLQQ